MTNPLHHWWKVRKVFKRPKCHFYIGKRIWFFGLPILDEYYNKYITLNISKLGYKIKYNDVRHEWDPYIQIRLFRKWDIILIFNYIDKNDPDSDTRNCATWEAMIDYIDGKSLKDCIFEHRWSSLSNKDKRITIKPNIREECLKRLNL